jgi:hypothetical protein
MKISFLLALLFVLLPMAKGEEIKMSHDLVVKFAKIIAADKEYKILNGYDLDHPKFDKKEKVWSFQHKEGPGSMPEAPLPIFEIRDSDAAFRVGYLFSSGVGIPKFKFPPKFRRQLKDAQSKEPKN